MLSFFSQQCEEYVMKKIGTCVFGLCAVFGLCGASSQICAQSVDGEMISSMEVAAQEGFRFEMGLKSGANLFTQKKYDRIEHLLQNKDYRYPFTFGFSGMLAFEFRFTRQISVEVDVAWTDTTALNIIGVAFLGYQTLTLPVLFKWRILSGSWAPFVGIGIKPMLVLRNRRLKSGMTYIGKYLEKDPEAQKMLENLDRLPESRFGFAALAVAGVVYDWDGLALSFEVRYSHTLVNEAFKDNREIGLLLGIQFPI